MTHGTGSFVDVSVEKLPRSFGRGILPLILFKSGKDVFYGVEGFLPTSGSLLDWIVESGLFSSHQELDSCHCNRSAQGLCFLRGSSAATSHIFRMTRVHFLGIDTETSRADIARAVYQGYLFLCGSSCKRSDHFEFISFGSEVRRRPGKEQCVLEDSFLGLETSYHKKCRPGCHVQRSSLSPEDVQRGRETRGSKGAFKVRAED